jgi:hypothetical protein
MVAGLGRIIFVAPPKYDLRSIYPERFFRKVAIQAIVLMKDDFM